MQRQYVLVNEGTLQEEQKKGGENHKNTHARWLQPISERPTDDREEQQQQSAAWIHYIQRQHEKAAVSNTLWQTALPLNTH